MATTTKKTTAKKAVAKAANKTAKKVVTKKVVAKRAVAKKAPAKKAAAKRTLVEPTPGDKRYVRRDADGQFDHVVDVGRSLSADKKRVAKKTVKPGQGDKGDVKK